MISFFLHIFALLLVAHAFCDYPLQGDFLARGKNHLAPLPGIPWWQCLGAHALIHAGAVAYVTGSDLLGVLEFICHFAIDCLKSAGYLSFDADQSLHWLCKALWAALLVFEPSSVVRLPL